METKIATEKIQTHAQLESQHWYDKHYKTILFLSLFLLFISIAYIIYTAVKTGDIMQKDVTLTGGTVITVYTDNFDLQEIESFLFSKFSDAVVRSLTDISSGKKLGFSVETKAAAEEVKTVLEQHLGYKLNEKNSSVEYTGASLSSSFYKELLKAMVLAFIFMAVVVFLIFRTLVPSLAVIQAALTDIVFSLAVANIIGLKISTAGIAALLMLIGYSVDTDILLTNRALRRKEGALNERIFGAFKTGITMTLTALAVVLASYFVVISPVLKQVFLILAFGLAADIVATWGVNAGILKWYCKKRNIL